EPSDHLRRQQRDHVCDRVHDDLPAALRRRRAPACYVRAVASKLPVVAISIVAIAAAISSCAPVIDGPVEHQRAIDRDDGDRLAAQLAQLPGVVGASVVLHHAMRDPLAQVAPTQASLAAVITIDDQAAPEAIRAAAMRLAGATLPELAPAVPAIEITATV